MTSHPPSGPPTGPPSGPLSGPSSSPESGGPPPPPGPPGGTGGGGGRGRGGREGGADGPWWRSVPKIAALTAVVVAAVALIIVLTRPDGGGQGAGGEVVLQPAVATGPHPYTPSTAAKTPAPQSPAALPSPTTPGPTNATRSVNGSAPGLYGGTMKVASCDVEKQIDYLSAVPAKNASFASVLGIQPNAVAGYLRSLTPLQLRVDTQVTNHGYRDGSATTYQAVLQTGTAVLVDNRGVPRVRCACGNPLTPPVVQRTPPRTTGDAWPGFRASNVVFVAPSVKVVNVFVIFDTKNGDWIARRRGDTEGKKDKVTAPPKHPPSASHSDSPSKPASKSDSTGPLSPLPCVTVTGGAVPPGGPSACPSTPSESPESPAPETSPDTGTPTETETGNEPRTEDGSPPSESLSSAEVSPHGVPEPPPPPVSPAG